MLHIFISNKMPTPDLPPEFIEKARETLAFEAVHFNTLADNLKDWGPIWGMQQATQALSGFRSASRLATGENAPRPSLHILHAIYRDIQLQDEPSERRCRFMSRQIIPYSGLGRDEPTGPACTIARNILVDTCPEAEPEFSKALQEVLTDSWQGHPRVSVYHDERHTPLFLRKSTKGVSTAVTLAPIRVGPMPVFPGTVVRLDETMSGKQTGEAMVTDNGVDFRYQTYQVSEPIRLALGRISAMAYADVYDRRLFALHTRYPDAHVSVNAARLPMLEALSPERLQQAAQKIMDCCGVRPLKPTFSERIINAARAFFGRKDK